MSTNYNNTLRAIKRGDFKTALNLVKKVEPSTTWVVKTFVCICTACVDQSTVDKFTMEDLSELMAITIKNLAHPTDSEKMDFLGATYYILKYLIKEDAIDVILEVKEVWCFFFDGDIPDQCIVTYKAQCTQLSQYLLGMLKSPATKRAEELSNLLFNMMDKLPSGILFNKGLYVQVMYLMKSTQNEMILSSLTEFMLRRCSEEEHYEQKLLELLSQMFAAPTFPTNLLFKTFPTYKNNNSLDAYYTLFHTLKIVVKDGISKKSLNLIYNSMKLMDELEDKFVYARILQQILNDFFYKNAYTGEHTLSWEFYELIRKTLLSLSSILGTAKRKCQNCKNCQLSRDVPSQLNVLWIATGLFKRCILNIEEISSDIINSTVELYNKIVALIDLMKNENCTYWENYLQEFHITLYNTAISINRKKDYLHYASIIFEIVVREYLRAQPFISTGKLLNYNCIHTSLIFIANNYLALGEIRDAMTITAFNVLKCSEGLNCSCTSQWIQVKTSKKRDLAIKKLTMASLLINVQFKKFTISVSKEDVPNILLKELKTYCSFWRSKIPLVECCKQVESINKPLLTIEALSLAWYDIPDSLLPEMYPIIVNVLEQVKNVDATNEQKIYIAKVYFLHYHMHIKTLQDDIDNQISMEPPESKDLDSFRYGLNVPDNKWDCTTYAQLKIENLCQIKAPLLNSRKMIERVFSSSDTEKKQLICELEVFEFITELAFAFLLHGDKTEYLKTLFLCNKQAQVISSTDWLVKTTGWIMREADVKAISPLFKEVKLCLSKVQDNIRAELYMNISMAYFNGRMIEKATQKYLKAKNMLVPDKVKDELLCLEMEFLEWNLLSLPCKNTIDDHYQEFIVKASLLCGKFQEHDYTNSRVKVMLVQYLMHTYVRYYHWLKSPRDGRSVAKTVVNLCQRHILPLRFAETFAYLADMDLLCEKLDDCQAKISGLSILLGIPTHNIESEKNINDDMNALTHGLHEITLDVKLPKMSYATSSASPELCRDTAEHPHFLSHDVECECFYCMSIDYQKLVITHIVLKGNLWASRNESKTADFFYNFALNIYSSIISNKVEYMQKIRKLFSIDFQWDVEDIFAECYANLLYNQGKIFVGTKKYNKISDDLLKTVEKIKFANTFLYNEAYLQRVNHLLSIQQVPTLRRLSPIVPNRNLSPVTTPEDHVTTVKIVTSISPKPVKTHHVRLIKFDWSGDEDECKNPSGKSSGIQKPQGFTTGASSATASASSTTIPNNPTKSSRIKVYSRKGKPKAKANVEEVAEFMNQLSIPKIKSTKSKSIPKLLVTTPSEDNQMETEQCGYRRSERNKTKK